MPNDSREFFIGKQEDYSRYRPTYSAKLFNYLTQNYDTKNMNLVELGAGTGKFTRDASDIFDRVFFVEPNKDMLDEGKIYCSSKKNITYVNCSAEDIKLESNSVDMVFAVQSFHWFDKERTKAEVSRILKSDGYFAIVWNNLEDDDNEFSHSYFNYISSWNTKISGRFYQHKNEEERKNFFRDGEYLTLDFSEPHKYTLEMLLGMTRSLSYAPQTGSPYYNEFYDGIKSIFFRYELNGYVTFDIHTIMYIGRV